MVKGAGGTPGGLVSFGIGLLMAVGGAYLLSERIVVSSRFWSWFGPHTSGLALLPFVVGAGLLFFNGKSLAGWILTVCGIVIVLLGVLMNLRIYFEPTSLFDTLLMLVLLAGGVGLMARALRPQTPGAPPPA